MLRSKNFSAPSKIRISRPLYQAFEVTHAAPSRLHVQTPEATRADSRGSKTGVMREFAKQCLPQISHHRDVHDTRLTPGTRLQPCEGLVLRTFVSHWQMEFAVK